MFFFEHRQRNPAIYIYDFQSAYSDLKWFSIFLVKNSFRSLP